MATGTEVAVTKLMWALGYNVPENHIAYVRREQLAIGATAKFTPRAGEARAMRARRPRRAPGRRRSRAGRHRTAWWRARRSRASRSAASASSARAPTTRTTSCRTRIVASCAAMACSRPGSITWTPRRSTRSTRSSRRTAARSSGTTCIDFGSTLGSGGVGPADYWAGSEYLLEPRFHRRSRLSAFGFIAPGWQPRRVLRVAVDRPAAAVRTATSIPAQWKPRVPNRAFLQARADDQFWAARKLVALRTDLLRAAVAAGDFGDPAVRGVPGQGARRAPRRHRPGLSDRGQPDCRPGAEHDGTLTFQNAAVDADVARAPEEYRRVWFVFDNATGQTTLSERPRRVPRRSTHRPTFLVELASTSRSSCAARARRTRPGKSRWMRTSGWSVASGA